MLWSWLMLKTWILFIIGGNYDLISYLSALFCSSLGWLILTGVSLSSPESRRKEWIFGHISQNLWLLLSVDRQRYSEMSPLHLRGTETHQLNGPPQRKRLMWKTVTRLPQSHPTISDLCELKGHLTFPKPSTSNSRQHTNHFCIHVQRQTVSSIKVFGWSHSSEPLTEKRPRHRIKLHRSAARMTQGIEASVLMGSISAPAVTVFCVSFKNVLLLCLKT